MGNNETNLKLCSGDFSALNLALGSGDFELAKEKSRDLEACALGFGNEELAAHARELGGVAAGKLAAAGSGADAKSSTPSDATFLANFSATLTQAYGNFAAWPRDVKNAFAKINAARGTVAFVDEAAKAINSLRLSPETYPAFEIGTALLANQGGEFFAAAKALEKSAASGFISDKTASFAYDFIFGNPENTLLPLYAAGKLGKLVEGFTAIGAETLGLARGATTALKTTTGLTTEAPAFVGTGKLVALEKGKPVNFDAVEFLKESFSSGVVFGALKFAGFLAQTGNAFLPATQAGQAAAFWNANFASIAALMGVNGAERLANGELAENKTFADAFIEAAVVHFGISAMMASISPNNLGAKIAVANKLAADFLKQLAGILPAEQLKLLAETTQGPKLNFELSDSAITSPEAAQTSQLTRAQTETANAQAAQPAKPPRPLEQLELNWDEVAVPKLENIADPRVTIFAPQLAVNKNIIAGSYQFYMSLKLLGYNIDIVENFEELPSRLKEFNPFIVGIAIFDVGIFNETIATVREFAPDAVTLAGGIGALNLHAIVADYVITGDASLGMAAGLNRLFRIIDETGTEGAKSQSGKKSISRHKGPQINRHSRWRAVRS